MILYLHSPYINIKSAFCFVHKVPGKIIFNDFYQSSRLQLLLISTEKVQEGKDQEKAQSEKDSHSKNRGGEKPNQKSGTYTMITYR